ncbi:phage tail tape measure protein, partial [Pseudomonas lundensis]
IFKGAINGLIEMLNKIPGVQIDAAFGDLPAPSQVPDIGVAQMQAQPAPPLVMAQTPVLPPAAAHAVQPLAASRPGAMSLATSLIPPTQAPA